MQNSNNQKHTNTPTPSNTSSVSYLRPPPVGPQEKTNKIRAAKRQIQRTRRGDSCDARERGSRAEARESAPWRALLHGALVPSRERCCWAAGGLGAVPNSHKANELPRNPLRIFGVASGEASMREELDGPVRHDVWRYCPALRQHACAFCFLFAPHFRGTHSLRFEEKTSMLRTWGRATARSRQGSHQRWLETTAPGRTAGGGVQQGGEGKRNAASPRGAWRIHKPPRLRLARAEL